jgi:hypothetical protein
MQMHSTAGIPAHILAIDLGPIMAKAMIEDGMTLEEVTLGARELRRFYTLHHLYPTEELSPTKLIDKIWHFHMQDTIYYPVDCNDMFGEFLHHFPYLGLRGEEDAILLNKTFDRTKELYRLTFGEDMPLQFGGTICGGGCAAKCKKTVERCGIKPTCSDSIKATECGKPCSSRNTRCVTPEAENCISGCSRTIHLPPRPSLEQYLAQLN